MSYSIDFTKEEIVLLKKLRRVEKDCKALRRYQCIWLSNEKLLKKEIAVMLGVDTITDWIKLFNKHRFEGLSKFHCEGRRPSSLDAIKDLLLKHIKKEHVSKLSEL